MINKPFEILLCLSNLILRTHSLSYILHEYNTSGNRTDFILDRICRELSIFCPLTLSPSLYLNGHFTFLECHGCSTMRAYCSTVVKYFFTVFSNKIRDRLVCPLLHSIIERKYFIVSVEHDNPVMHMFKNRFCNLLFM